MKDLLLPLNLQFFAENEGAETIPDGQEPAKENLADAEDALKAEESPKTFTQAELDEIIGKKIGKLKSRYADYDEIKTKASEYESKLEEQRLAELTEKERAEETAKKFEEEKNALQAQLDALRKESEQTAIKAEFTKVATGAGITYIDDAYALAQLADVKFEDGKVVGIDDAVQALVENKPFLIGKKPSKPIGEATNNSVQTPDKTAEQLLQEAAQKAKASGRIEDRVAFDKLKRQLGKV